MEGKVRLNQESFSNALIEISKTAILPDEDRRILEFYIAVAYGHPFHEITVPFECAKTQGLFKEYVEKTEREIHIEYETKRSLFARCVCDATIPVVIPQEQGEMVN